MFHWTYGYSCISLAHGGVFISSPPTMVITSWPFGTRRRVCAAGTVIVSAATKSSSVSSAPQSEHIGASRAGLTRVLSSRFKPTADSSVAERHDLGMTPEKGGAEEARSSAVDCGCVAGAVPRWGAASSAPTDEGAGVWAPHSGQTYTSSPSFTSRAAISVSG